MPVFFMFSWQKVCLNLFLNFFLNLVLAQYTLVTQPMLQHQPNRTELRLMDSHVQILCRFRKCKQKVPSPSLPCTKKSSLHKIWI